MMTKSVSFVLKQVSELRFIHVAHLTNLNRQLLTVRKQSFLLHVVWSQYVALFAFAVFIWTLFFRASLFFKEEFAILGPAVRGSDHACIEDVLVEREDGKRSILRRRVRDVRCVADLRLA